MNRRHGIVIAAFLALAVGTVGMHAYTIGDKVWGTNVVTFYVNPNTIHTSAESAEEALKGALAAWGTQSNADFRFAYGGRVNDTATGFDYRNVTIFRNGTDGGMLASTYTWWAGNTLATAKLVDADVIFWDGQMQFFGAYDYCTGGGGYIQDIATHEYGHALGLAHSGDPTSTMYGSYNACDSSLRTLSADDIAGVEYLYPPTSNKVSNTAPSVRISSPENSTTFVAGVPINFSATANDSQDGDLSGGLTWTSSLSGYIWTGSSFLGLLPAGTHVITASVTDSGGISSSAQVTVTVTSDPTSVPPSSDVAPSSPTLTVRAYKVRGQQRADLSWSNLDAATVNIMRDGSPVYSGSNYGVYMDLIGGKGSGDYMYQVCDPTNTVCTNMASASF